MEDLFNERRKMRFSKQNHLIPSQNNPVSLMLETRLSRIGKTTLTFSITPELTESLLADHRVTGLAGLTLPSFVHSLDPK